MQYSEQLLLGMLNILRFCPPEATPYRKELIIAIRHISSTALKDKFVPHLESLFNDDVLFGHGLTVKESLRALGYHVIAELVHQEGFQFRWLKIKGIYAVFPISIALYTNHLK